MKIFNRYIKIISSVFLCTILWSCKKFIDIAPPDSKIVSEVVFSNDETAIAAVMGMYHQLYEARFSSGSRLGSVTYLGALSADEIRLGISSTVLIQFEDNEIVADNSTASTIWISGYNIIYHANAILKGLESSSGLSDDVKQELEGSAKFIRAFTHFYLLNFYGDVPLITSTDYNSNTLAARNSVEEVYSQIMQDLTDAYGLLSTEYPDADRTRANKSVVAAFLARVYLYRGDWINAELMASKVIGETSTYELLDDLNNVFLKDSREAIWSITPIGAVNHTKEGNSFILFGGPWYFTPCVLTDGLVNAFENGDKRYANWVGVSVANGITYYYPYKYKVSYSYQGTVTEHSSVIRLAEMYLIRAEARIQQNKIPEGIADLNILRDRARGDNQGDLPALLTTLSKEDALLKVEQERRIELFTEWGHRWLDLKRTGRATSVLGPLKIGWESTDLLYPIPESERDKNPNLGQNDGY